MRTQMVRKGKSVLLRQLKQGEELRVYEYPDNGDIKIHDFKTEREVVEFLGVLDKVLKALEKEGYKIRTMEEVIKHVNVLGATDLFAGRENFKVEYSKEGTFRFETTWSNQEVTRGWLEKVNKIYHIIEGR